MATQVKPSPWGVNGLYNSKEANKCNAAIVDTILFQGDPKWYFTSKNGEVTKKRNCIGAAVKDRFMRMLDASTPEENPLRRVAVLRFNEGGIRIVDETAFDTLMNNWPPREAGLEALQAYVPSGGSAGTVYRNTYKVVSDKGRVNSLTQSYTTVPPEKAHVGVVSSDTRSGVQLTVSRAAALNQTLDGATRTVVRYLESSHRVRVLSVDIDYIVDTDSQLWLSWVGDCSVATGDALLDLTLAGLDAARGEGRDSWLPDDTRLLREAEKRQAVEAMLAGGKKAPSSPLRARRPNHGPSALSEEVRNRQVATAAEVAEALAPKERLDVIRKGHKERVDDEDRQAMGGRAFDDEDLGGSKGAQKGGQQQKRGGPGGGGSGDGDFHAGTLPNPFRSKGDFRKVALRDPSALDLNNGNDAGGLDGQPSLLPVTTTGGNEGGGGDGVDLLNEQSGAQQTRVSYQSISRARAEAKQMTQDEKRARANEDEDAGGGGGGGGRRGGRRGAKSSVLEPTEASESRRKWAEQRGQVPGGAANFYQEVAVTQKDLAVYALLDRARRLRERQERLAEHDEDREDASNLLPPVSLENAASGSMSRSGSRSGFGSRGGGGGGGGLDDESSSSSSSSSSRPRSKNNNRRPRTGDDPNAYTRAASPGDTVGREGGGGGVGGPPSLGGAAVSWRHRLAENSKEGGAAREDVVQGAAQKFEKMDDYLRNTVEPAEKARSKRRQAIARSQGAQERLKEQKLDAAAKAGMKPVLQGGGQGLGGGGGSNEELYFASVLICDAEGSKEGEKARDALEKAGYFVDVEWDGRKVVDMLLYQGKKYDCLLLERNGALCDGFEVCESVRQKEKEERALRQQAHSEEMRQARLGSKHVRLEPFVALPVIAFTACVSPDDLRAYMEVGMDGCVSKPLEVDALLATVRAAAPQHAKPLPDKVKNAVSANALKGGGHEAAPNAKKMGILGTIEGGEGSQSGLGSAVVAAQSLSLPSSFTAADGSMSGVLQLDSETCLPYTVIDFSMTPTGARPSTAERHAKPFFNLVVCHDFFDTLERMKIVLSPLAARYPGLQVLLWNYPGQAFTEWRSDQLLNNDYLASCLHELLSAIGAQGNLKQFDSDKPFHLLGFGNGANVSTFYASHYNNPNLRSLIHCNGFAFVDPHLAGALHDCMNVFSCAPPSRPDLPVYFYSRFLFSPAYLASVSTPLALNLYTAVHNPITLAGRIQLCLGSLSHVDLRPQLAEIDLPIITVQATQGALVKPVHSEVFVEHRRGGAEQGEAKTIYEALKAPHKSCVVWVKSGHELFQEAREQVVTLVEQMCTGYHETHDVAFQSSVATDPHAPHPAVRQGQAGDALGHATHGALPAKKAGAGGGGASSVGHGNFEDAFIDNVLGQVKSAVQPSGAEQQQGWESFSKGMSERAGPAGQGPGGGPPPQQEQTADELLAIKQGRARPKRTKADLALDAEAAKGLVLDATAPSFERQDNVVYKAGGSRIYPAPEEFPEVKEYMVWRLKRNRKRLQRLDQAARIVQGAFRSYLAWSIVRRLREARAAAFIQRLYRGWKGRMSFLDHMRLIWAAQVVQRAWRGFAGRKFFSLLRRMHAAAAHIQRIGRGYVGRRVAWGMKEGQRLGALKLQNLFRKRQARKNAFVMKKKVHGARTLQRVYRGHLGRRRATHEREKFLFSKSQSQGIEFGRQMLLEHKLHATRLQSEVQLLTQEKVGAEEQVEALLEEISEFEEAVTQLEQEMHDLSRIETEAAGVLDEDGRFELREQKTRLDREFGEMLAKIGDRRERLTGLESKLATLDRARQSKEEELRTLERKLVVLLDEQQRELESIKRRQEKKGELLLKTQDAISGASGGGGGGGGDGGGGGGGGGYGGPSQKDKQQAAQLMQSTETLMKFGFMSMSMTYFSSLNMVRAMRNVSATDTVMAALHENAQQQQHQGGGAGGGGGGGGGFDQKLGGEAYRPALRPGQMPGDEALKVSAWSVDDVSRWLQTLALGQYREAFVDASVDGAFLYDLNEEDLKNTLGIEHRLHRKKLMGAITKLKLAEAEKSRQLQLTMAAERAAELGLPPPISGMGDEYLAAASAGSPGSGGGGGAYGSEYGTDAYGGGAMVPTAGGDDGGGGGALLNFEELAALVRHSKLKKVKESLALSLPSRRFDPHLVKAPYVEDFGTAYVDAYEMEAFNLNKVDEFGNSLLIVASQNGSLKIAKLLVEKGANPNHQNREGQTAAHFANEYGFMNFLTWVFEGGEDGAGGDDGVANKYGLTPYDGMRA